MTLVFRRRTQIFLLTYLLTYLGVDLWSRRSRGPSSMSVPNLKRIAVFVQKLLGGSQNFEIWSRDLGHAHLGVVLWSRRSRGPSSMSAKFEADCCIRSKVIRGVPKFRNLVT